MANVTIYQLTNAVGHNDIPSLVNAMAGLGQYYINGILETANGVCGQWVLYSQVPNEIQHILNLNNIPCAIATPILVATNLINGIEC